jgi:glycyl-tRNA synthetase
VESSVGVGRTMLAILTEAYTEEEIQGEKRIVMKFPARLAPIKAAVFPLVKNKPDLVEFAKKIYHSLQPHLMVEFDDNGNIGKRYRRQDEIGTPYSITVDYQSLEDMTVTIRDRDTMRQQRIPTDKILPYLEEKNI